MVYLKKYGKEAIKIKHGFSWTCLFFSFLVPTYRYDYKWMGILMATQGFAILIGLTHGGIEGKSFAFISVLVLNIIFSCYYNNIFIKEKVREGYTLIDSEEYERIAKMNDFGTNIEVEDEEYL